MTDKKIPTVEELTKSWINDPIAGVEALLVKYVQPLLDRLAEAEKPRTSWSELALQERLIIGGWDEDESDRLASFLWPLIESRAVVPDGYFRIGNRVKWRADFTRYGTIGIIPDGPESNITDVSNGTFFVERVQPKHHRTNREKVLALHNLPDPTAISTVLLRVAEGETLDALCAEFGVALEVDEI